MKRRGTIPTILGVFVLIFGSAAGVYLSNNVQVFNAGADSSSAVKNIRVSNITDNSVSITWTTDKETTGHVVWGQNQNSVNNVAQEDNTNKKYFNHSVDITGLSPSSKYYYRINSEGTTYENSGIPWELTTGPSIGTNRSSLLLSGTVINASGIPEKKALVYANIGGYLLSTVTSETGNFVFQTGSTRSNNLNSYLQINPKETLIQISVQANPNGVVAAQIFPQSANPIPPLVIGQTYDFRNNAANNSGENPNSNLSLPQDNVEISKFNVAIPDTTPKPTSVILESLTDGEIITSQKPQFFGKGPSGTNLTITVNSENPVTGDVQIPKDGSWQYSVPSNLDPGSHTITVSWIDVSGITRFLTRSFIVKAGEIPAFTASQSGSLSSPTPSTKPVASPSLKPNATTRPTTAPTPKATQMPVPVSGDFTPTLFLFIMSLGIIAFSLFIWKATDY